MKNKEVLIPILALVFFCSAQMLSGQATRLTVPGDYSTIQAAVDAANEGDTVLVSDGTYYENIRIYSKSFVLASEYILDGDEEHISNTILDGSDPVLADSASVILIRNCLGSGPLIKGFTITGGGGTKNGEDGNRLGGGSWVGGGIAVLSSGATIENNIITKNEITGTTDIYGGGICAGNFISDMQVFIRNNTISDNHIHNVHPDSPAYAEGAGIFVGGEFGLKLIENNNIFENTATCIADFKAIGGGIGVGTMEPWATPVIIKNNRIANNAAYSNQSFGGGMYLSFPPGGKYSEWSGRGPIEICNNLIVNNLCEDRGGGIAVWTLSYQMVDVSDPNPLIYNNTIVNNFAREGGALFNYDVKPLLFNNILWNNAGGAGSSEIFMEDLFWLGHKHTNAGKVLCMYNDIKYGYTGATNIDLEPCWLPDSYAPDSLNKCVGRGIDTLKINGIVYAAPSTDYYGNPRPNPVDDLVDMGAIESSFRISAIEPSALKDPPAPNAYQVFPNPARDHVMLLADQYGNYTLELYASNGQLVRKRAFIGTSCHVDLTSCHKGLYVLMIRSRGDVWTGKIVKQ